MIVVGEALVDLVEEEDGRFDPRPGGSARNVAIAAARLGTPVQWTWGLGDDTFADRFRDEFAAEGVDVGLAVTTDVPTPLAVVAVDADGSPSYGFHLAGTAATAVDAEALERLPQDQPLHVSLGAVTLLTEGVGASLRDLLRRRGDTDAMTTLDPNARPAFLGDPAAQRAALAAAVASCAIVRCSDEDLELLVGGAAGDDAPTADEVVTSWLDAGAAAVVVTRGEHGSTVRTHDLTTTVPATAADVVDTVGAGDTFGAAMLTALRDRGVATRGAVASLDEGDWAAVLGFAAAAAAVTVSRRGADPPTRAEVERAPVAEGDG